MMLMLMCRSMLVNPVLVGGWARGYVRGWVWWVGVVDDDASVWAERGW